MSGKKRTIIYTYRKMAGLSQEELARMLQVSQATISQWERGILRPRWAHLYLLSRALRIPLSQLVREFGLQEIDLND